MCACHVHQVRGKESPGAAGAGLNVNAAFGATTFFFKLFAAPAPPSPHRCSPAFPHISARTQVIRPCQVRRQWGAATIRQPPLIIMVAHPVRAILRMPGGRQASTRLPMARTWAVELRGGLLRSSRPTRAAEAGRRAP